MSYFELIGAGEKLAAVPIRGCRLHRSEVKDGGKEADGPACNVVYFPVVHVSVKSAAKKEKRKVDWMD